MCEGGGYIYINIYKKKKKDRTLEEAAKDPRKPEPRAGLTSWTRKKKKRSDAEKLSGSRWVSFDS